MSSEPVRSSKPEADPRIRFAAERTLLAWIRTGLAMMGFGFVVARFGLFIRELAAANHRNPGNETGLSLWLGTVLVTLGATVNLIAAMQYRQFLKRYKNGEIDLVPRWSLRIASALALAGVGIAMIVYLVSL